MINIFKIFHRKDIKSSTDWEEMKGILEPYKKLAWIPTALKRKSSNISSKFSGIPALLKTEDWPCCSNCNEPMQLFLQLNAKDLPTPTNSTFGSGILQVFYCTNMDKECEITCEAYLPFAQSTLVRIINPDDDNILNLKSNPVNNPFPEKEIINWDAKEDYPNPEELESLGCVLSDKQSELLYKLDYPKPKDKLLGWPCWTQGVEYPDCPECGEPMKLIFQIDSKDNLPYMFGDLGCAHVTQCRQHHNQLSIAWACG